jgi:methylated-DNA-[protein]-cysteine S-methyltransferase
MNYRYLESPIGEILVAGDAEGLKFVGFPSGKGRLEPDPSWQLHNEGFADVKKQLAEYFAGKRTKFELKLAPNGTPFQLQVLDALQRIPYGETRSYRDIANGIGKPKAVRAVGAANGRNPLPIIIPCHRVIGADGSLTGFGGGLPTKRYLLELEQGGRPSLV